MSLNAFMSSINVVRSEYDVPPTSTVVFDFSLSSRARILIASPSFIPITVATALSIVSCFTPSHVEAALHSTSPIETPICKTSVTSFALLNCSAMTGHATIATPPETPSKTEFHPQCVKNPPTDS
ncbi:hypothetical protein HanIR_Chr10g0482471 [Helianthus annuus]|nr:hypothetical protein HanIR_Chr10g0482471 [Helianthus annuus]